MSAIQPRIGIIIGSTREGRFGDKPAQWIYNIAKERADLSFELVDLRDHPLPYFAESVSPAWGPVSNVEAQRWAQKLDTLDGLIVVTPEYNHGPTAVLKNAFDYAYKEFARKPISFVGYGGVGAARAVEQLRLVAVELQMAPVRNAVHIGMVEFMGIWQQGKQFEDFPHLTQAAGGMLDDLAWWAKALKSARSAA
ncbi:NADPH-dependent oxidoreductase [Dickeya dianthicola]|uniref:NADPH-dependent oxidoreductase n=1 Tax=Dickeya dianthicola TaxID=204039 RepID=A0ABX9NLS3_9GAMM|nr:MULTISPECIES: NAD(P)H-dependent oxidoreductase [Pectobacteriaceae]QQG27146.1 NAD(P)H-dependent oxidoreductase [Pectobacterium carotovorum]MCA6914386.1 NAD(P)H-dependent oxidoreductase [Pectobacterium versatile]MCI4068277.1 NAD(P)H-dependent oxidoreductase [Dickeya dianthicola]MCI4113440.1 NAD(P)H-dependent oxidoreductase [Dickeya dianthicola]MCI4118560.1 NAD(P)H-dependent oxidoreductase [Dickeya dianthicola]